MVGMYIVEQTPQLGIRMEDVAQLCEGSICRHGKPVAHWLPPKRSLSLQIVCDLRNRIPLRIALVSGNVFISAAEHYRLKDDPVNLLDVICNESNDVANPTIIQSVHHGYLKCGFHAGRGDVVQSLSLDFHIVAESAVTILFFGDSVELQINAMKSGSPRANG